MATRVDYDNFLVSLCDVGNVCLCLYSYTCFPCARAQARTNMDGSSCCFNLWCLGPVTTRCVLCIAVHFDLL